MGTVFNAVGYPNGSLGWTLVGGGFDIGKDQAVQADRFCTWNGGSGQTSFNGAAIYPTPAASQADHIVLCENCILPSGKIMRIFINSNSTKTSFNEFQVDTSGGWLWNSDSGNVSSGSGTGITAATSFSFAAESTDGVNVVLKVNGATITTTSSQVRTGLYGGVLLEGDTTPCGIGKITFGVADVGGRWWPELSQRRI